MVLVIGGSDSSGGAGVARDLSVLAHCSVDASVAITAVTAQTDGAVHVIHHVPTSVVVAQIKAVMASRASRRVAAIKIGMLGTRAIVEAIADALPVRAVVPIVLDPVHVASSGRALLDAEGFNALRERLLPLATLITPNIPEAAALLGAKPAHTESQMIEQAERIASLGADSVLLKGGHTAGTDVVDILVRQSQDPLRLRATRLSIEMRGTGCALASGIAAQLARGATLEAACEFAKRYVHSLLTTNVSLQ